MMFVLFLCLQVLVCLAKPLEEYQSSYENDYLSSDDVGDTTDSDEKKGLGSALVLGVDGGQTTRPGRKRDDGDQTRNLIDVKRYNSQNVVRPGRKRSSKEELERRGADFSSYQSRVVRPGRTLNQDTSVESKRGYGSYQNRVVRPGRSLDHEIVYPEYEITPVSMANTGHHYFYANRVVRPGGKRMAVVPPGRFAG